MRSLHDQAGRGFHNGLYGRLQLDCDSYLARPLHEPVNQVRIKAFQAVRAPMQDCNLRAGSRRHVGKFEGNIAPTDEDDPARQLLQLEKFVAGNQMLFAADTQLRGAGSRGNHNVFCFKPVIADLNCARPCKMRWAVEGGDPGLGKAFFSRFGHRLRKGSLKANQFRPDDARVSREYSLAFHSPRPVNGFSRSHQYLLWIAAPEHAGPAEWPRINNRDFPALPAASRRHRRARRARPDDHQVKCLRQLFPPPDWLCATPSLSDTHNDLRGVRTA